MNNSIPDNHPDKYPDKHQEPIFDIVNAVRNFRLCQKCKHFVHSGNSHCLKMEGHCPCNCSEGGKWVFYQLDEFHISDIINLFLVIMKQTGMNSSAVKVFLKHAIDGISFGPFGVVINE